MGYPVGKKIASKRLVSRLAKRRVILRQATLKGAVDTNNVLTSGFRGLASAVLVLYLNSTKQSPLRQAPEPGR